MIRKESSTKKRFSKFYNPDICSMIILIILNGLIFLLKQNGHLTFERYFKTTQLAFKQLIKTKTYLRNFKLN